jgi:outer membrane protein OmpA-like peptidoglycan-associated protein
MGLLLAAMEIDGLNAGKLAAMDLDLSRDANDENAHALCPGEREPVLTSSAAALAGLSASSDRYRTLDDGKVALEVNVTFGFDSAAISSAFDSEIGVAATTLRDNANVRAEVEGHTDSIGDDNYNQRLSERRAMAVRDLLVDEYGVAASQVTAVGRGETMPLASNKSAEGRNANRRVDLVLDIVK